MLYVGNRNLVAIVHGGSLGPLQHLSSQVASWLPAVLCRRFPKSELIEINGGCSRTRTCDPLIKSPGETQQNQCCFPQFMPRSTYGKALKLLELPSRLGNRR